MQYVVRRRSTEKFRAILRFMFSCAFETDRFLSTGIGPAIELPAVTALLDVFKFRGFYFYEKSKEFSVIKNMAKL